MSERAIATIAAIGFSAWAVYAFFVLITTGEVWIPVSRLLEGTSAWHKAADAPGRAAIVLVAYVAIPCFLAFMAHRAPKS